MSELVAEGGVRHIGLSEMNADTLRRACATALVAALHRLPPVIDWPPGCGRRKPTRHSEARGV
ncbi:hypothetical protein [Streptomyces sp. A1-5]|uniref:hypothetical protein n=1 Tax=Streptomyces sp. A1-5 TaxID=2738410 RepID=UPI002E1B7A31|nr:hypothetical protein HRD51_15605 [Streptomyces sp. A1-5]